MSLEKLRALPEFQNASDAEIIGVLAKASNLPLSQVASAFGVDEGSKWGNRLSASIDNYQGNWYGLVEAATGADWARRGRERNEAQADLSRQFAADQGAVMSYKDIDGIGSGLDWFGGLAIDSAPYLLEAAAGGVAGRAILGPTKAALLANQAAKGTFGLSRNAASTIGGVTASYPSSAGDILQNQREAGDSQMQLGTALLGAVPYAALNAVGLEGGAARGSLLRSGIRRLDDMTGVTGGLARGGVAFAKNAATEGPSETGQEVINQYFGRMAMDPSLTLTDPDAIERYKESFVGGAALGGGAGAALGGWRRSEEYQPSGRTVDDGPTDLLNGFSPSTTLGLEGVAGQRPLAPPVGTVAGPLGDLTPDRGTSRGFEDLRQPEGVDAAGMYPLPGEAPVIPNGTGLIVGRELGIADRGRPTETEIPGVNLAPESMPVDFMGTVAGTDQQVGQMNDPGAVLARQQWMAQQERVAEQSRIAAETRQRIEAQRKRAAEVGLKGDRAAEVLARLDEALRTGLITDSEFGENLGMLQARKVGSVDRFLTATEEQKRLLAESDAKEKQDLIDRQRKKYERERAAAATGSAAGTSAAPVQTPAGPVATPAPAANRPGPAPAADPAPVAGDAATVTKAADRARTAWDKVRRQAVSLGVDWMPEYDTLTDNQKDQVDDLVKRDWFNLASAETVSKYVERKVKSAQETSEDARFRREFPRLIQDLPREEAELLQDWLGLDFDENGDAIPREAALSYSELGATLVDEKTGKLGISKQAVEGRIQRVLNRLGAPKDLSRERLRERLGVQAAGTDLETMTRNTDVAVKDTEQGGRKGRKGVIDQEAPAEVDAAAPEDEGDQDLRAAAEDLEAGTNDDRFEREDGTEEKNPEQTVDAIRKAEPDENGDLLEFLEYDLEQGWVLPSDIAEVVFAYDVIGNKGRGAFNKKPTSHQAAAVRYYARLRASGADSAVETKRTFDAYQKARAGTEPATSDPQAARQGTAETGRVESSADGLARSPRQSGSQVPPAGSQAARPLVVTRKRRSINRDALGIGPTDINPETTRKVNEDIDAPQVPVNRDVLGSYGTGSVFEFTDVEAYVGGVDTLTADFREAGIPNALRHVSEWKLTDNPDPNSAHGETSVEYGRYVITLNVAHLSNPGYAAEVARHEVGHAVDMGVHGGVYSIQPEMQVRIADGKVYPLGSVAAQIIQLTRRFPEFKKYLNYPLNIKKFSEMTTPERIQHELFAQIFAVYTTAKGRQFLEAEAPIVAAYFKEVMRDVNSARPVQIPTTEIANRRTLAFQARPGQRTGQGGAGTARLPGQVGQGALLSRSDQLVLPKINTATDALGSFWQTVKDGASWVGLRTMFTEDLVNLAAKHLPSARKYKVAMDQIEVVRGNAERKVAAILQDFRKLPQPLQGVGPGSVNQLLMDATMKRTWPYAPEWQPDAAIDTELATRFNALPEAARDIVRRVFAHGRETLLEMRESAVANIRSEYDGAIAAAKAEGDSAEVAKLEAQKAKSSKEFQTLFEMSGTWPYAPLKRFGNYVVQGVSEAYRDANERGDTKAMQELEKSEEHYFVAFVDSRREARALQDKIRDRYADTGHFERLNLSEAWIGGRDMLSSFQRLRTLVKDAADADADLTKTANKNLDVMMRQLYLMMLSENSARKAELNRRNIAGADNDMMRAFATQGRASAHFIASLKTNGAVTDHLRTMMGEVRNRLADRDQKQAYYNEIMRRHVMTLEYVPSGLVEKAMAGTSVWMLLTNPSYFLVNATQPWLMTQPLLAAKHGYGRSSQALYTAYKEVAPLLKDGTFDETDYHKLPKDVRQAVEDLANQGVIDISLESVLGTFESASDSPVRKFDWAMQKMRSAAQTVEALNRLTTAMAAYRMELQRTNSHEKSVEYAARAIYETHGDYSGFNAPRFMRRGIGKLATQFRKFQLIQLSMYARLLNRAFKDADPQERAIARQALIYNFSHMFAAGGLMGMPGFAAIAWLAGAVFGDDEPDDPEATLRRAIGNKELADLLLKGVPKLGGVDISGRVGAGGMLSILPYTDIEVSRDGYAQVVTGLLGPFVGGLAPRTVDGLALIGSGDYWKGVEQLMPSGLANTMKGVRISTEGLTQRNGDVVLSADEISFMQGLMQAVGLPTNTVRDRSFLANAKFKADTHFSQKTSELKRAYTEAFRDGDETARREVIREWMSVQVARKRLGYKTQPLSELLQAPREQRKREQATVGGVQVRDSNRRFVEQLTQ